MNIPLQDEMFLLVSFEFPVETTWFRIFYLSEVLLSSICCK